jgi:hypothetical protein
MFIGSTGKSRRHARINERAVLGKHTLVKLVVFSVLNERESKVTRVKIAAWIVVSIGQMTNKLKVVKSKSNSVIENTKGCSPDHITVKVQTLIELIGWNRYMNQHP